MTTRLKRIRNRLAHRVARLVTQDWRSYRQFEELYLGRLLKELRVDCVLDVGANVGQYATMLREYCGYEGLILSFEPTPAVVTKLKQASQRDHLWHVFGIALGKENGLMPFRTMPPRFSVANSFRRIRNERLDAECHIVDVEVRRLADLLPELQAQYGFTRPFLKMDTQGFDLEVFQGAKQVWSSIVGLQSELTIESFYDDSPGWQESLEVYQGAGFALSAFVANNLDWFPRLREMDVLMFRPGASPGEVDGLASSS